MCFLRKAAFSGVVFAVASYRMGGHVSSHVCFLRIIINMKYIRAGW